MEPPDFQLTMGLTRDGQEVVQMKKIVLFLLPFCFAIVGAADVEKPGAPVLPCGQTDLETVILIPLEGPAIIPDATGKVTFCKNDVSRFRLHVALGHLLPNHSYVLALNGWNGKPGNNKLMKQFETFGALGKYDFATVTTDAHGSFDTQVEIPDLCVGDYDVKLLVKDPQQSFHVILAGDHVKFEVVQIVLQVPEKVDEPAQLVSGRVSESTRSVYVFLHPITTKIWHVQNLPTAPTKKGEWHTLCYFGTQEVGTNEYYEVVAIAAREKGVFKEGATLENLEMRKVLEQYADSRSEISVVFRPE
jgi:hypothetical protein